MDLSNYLKQNRSRSYRNSSDFGIEKRCMQCGKKIESREEVVYPRFCSQECKGRYIGKDYE